MKKHYAWKFLREGMKSQNGDMEWKKGKWNKVAGKLIIYERGLHCSQEPYDAFSYVQGEILAKVECRGESIIQNDKECWSEQRVVKAYKWTKKDSVELAIYAAKQVLSIYEKQYPNDKRPRKAIEVAVKYIKNLTEKNRLAAYSARAAAYSAAYAAAYVAADSAAYAAAYSAARAADAAAYSAARAAANAAARAAYSAAYSAARAADAAMIKKIRAFFKKQVKKLKEI